MSAVSGAGSAAAVGSASNNSDRDRQFGALSNNEFFEIMMSELTQQDPLEPNDTKALMEQIALIRSIESNQTMTDSLRELVDQSSFASAAGLIGALVSGVSEDGRRVQDLVLSVSRTAQGSVLNLWDGSRVNVENVDEIVGGFTPQNDDTPPDDDDDTNDDNGDGTP